MALLGGSGTGPHRQPVDDRRWNAAEAEFKKLQKRSTRGVFLLLAAAFLPAGLVLAGLGIHLFSDSWDPIYSVGTLLLGLGGAGVWALVPALLGGPFYAATQTAAVESSTRSRRWGTALTSAAVSPSVLHVGLLVWGVLDEAANPGSSLWDVLGPVINPLRGIMIAVPIVMALALLPNIRRSESIRKARKQPLKGPDS
ncbi:MAG: hypothetical protein ABS910_01640 [Arthrobacter sp.]